jgi:hypothetical protein
MPRLLTLLDSNDDDHREAVRLHTTVLDRLACVLLDDAVFGLELGVLLLRDSADFLAAVVMMDDKGAHAPQGKLGKRSDQRSGAGMGAGTVQSGHRLRAAAAVAVVRRLHSIKGLPSRVHIAPCHVEAFALAL